MANASNRRANGTPLERASIAWLIAYEVYHQQGTESLQLFVTADENLLEAFCADWKNADPQHVRLAYAAYQDNLLKMHEPEPVVIPVNLNDMPMS